jgi:hypothetical protein
MYNGCEALTSLVEDNAAAQRAANGAHAAVPVLAALTAHRSHTFVQMRGCTALSALFRGRHLLGAPAPPRLPEGAIDTVVGTLRSSLCPRVYERNPSCWDVKQATALVYSFACRALGAMTEGDDVAAMRALRAGALEAFTAGEGAHARLGDEAEAERARCGRTLRAAAARHDEGGKLGACDAACARCAEARARGAVCALPGCGARHRRCAATDDAAGGSGGAASAAAAAAAAAAPKALLRCGRCRVARFCCAAHQREDWERHKGECKRADAPQQESGDDDGDAAQ